MSERSEKFKKEREVLNKLVLDRDNLNIKRFFGIDSAVYRDGALDSKTKEMIGLAASLVLRCDDCITYHVIQLKNTDLDDNQFDEIMSVGLVVGGSITIPHVRRAVKLWNDLKDE
jgi:AhpD family alkylhydroperoxidase